MSPASAKNAGAIQALQQLRDSLQGQVKVLETLNWGPRQLRLFTDAYFSVAPLLHHLQRARGQPLPAGLSDPYGLAR